MLSWANRFSIFCFLDSQHYTLAPHRYECLLGAGATDSLATGSLAELDGFLAKDKSWALGHLSYELGNGLHGLPSSKQDPIGFPPAFFFRPQVLIQLQDGRMTILADDPEKVYLDILAQEPDILHHISPLHMQQRLTKDAYLEKVRQLRQHIIRGDCYEVNFCQEFYAENAVLDPISVYKQLTHRSPNPFCALYRWHDRYLICASPERYLLKEDSRLFSQPMKGTIGRNTANPVQDEALKETLRNSAKDRSENVMVVDMVRNDLSRICREGTVRAEELFGVYAYPAVHQMISTISGELRENTGFTDIIAASFPMGSMTGAPKQRVMELIGRYEVSARGIFSGSVGYINPAGDFDLNVVIRSIMYHAGSGYLSYQVGSGITFYSDPEKEWEECLLKGSAIRSVLGCVQQ